VSIKTYQLSREIMKNLDVFTREVIDGMNEVGEQVTQKAVRTLRDRSPVRTKEYRKGWTVKKLSFINAPARFTIHNRHRYRLTHLLEFGHANRDGTRTKARPHVGPVEQQVIEEYLNGVEQVIKDG